ncbi:dihydroorotate dehydrogenase electron transfer subunit, partial [Candidatus Roizmanbacteria bacterium]|nr:dihydroorotate dehydrogenase electron transfer subunit [Candidatus Roizmanbacteria bacterium]
RTLKTFYRTATIKTIERENHRIKNFTLDTNVDAKPGQYVMVWIPRLNEKPFGVLTSRPLRLSVARIGEFTDRIHRLKVGDILTFKGPYGTSFKNIGKKKLLVVGGYGYIPLYFFCSQLARSHRKKTTIILGAKTKKDLSFISKFKKLGCQVKITTDDGSRGYQGFSTALARKYIQGKKVDSAYACGPEAMMEKVAEYSHKYKIPCLVSIERFFKCGGMGICGECSYNGLLVCKDGPVFNGRVLIKD